MNSHGFKPLNLRGFVLVEAISGGGQVSSRGPGTGRRGVSLYLPSLQPRKAGHVGEAPLWLPPPPSTPDVGELPHQGGEGERLAMCASFLLAPSAPSVPPAKGKYWFSYSCLCDLTWSVSTHLHAAVSRSRSIAQACRVWDSGQGRGAPSALSGVRPAHTLTPPSPSSRAFSFAAPAPFALCCHRVVIGRINLARAGSRKVPGTG